LPPESSFSTQTPWVLMSATIKHHFEKYPIAEYSLLPEPGVSFKTSGGVLDFYLFTGKQPEEVVQLYLGLIGRPMMPPFWGLGFQISRYGYKNTEDIQKVIARNRKHHIPFVSDVCHDSFQFDMAFGVGCPIRR